MRASLSVLLATSILSQQVAFAEAVTALSAEKLNGMNAATKVSQVNIRLLDQVQSYMLGGLDANTVANEIILDADNFAVNTNAIADLINEIQAAEKRAVSDIELRMRILDLERALTQQARVHNQTQDGKRRIAKIVGAVSGLVVGAGTGLFLSRGKSGGDLMVLVPQIFGLTMGAAVGVGGGYAISSIVGRAMFEKIDVDNIDLEGGK